MRCLLVDPEDTAQVFVILRSLSSSRAFNRLFSRVMTDPTGRKALAERPPLVQLLEDREYLQSLPQESLGWAYARFCLNENLRADGLAEPSQVMEDAYLSPSARRLAERLRDSHDLWHVVTGYGRDLLGEGALLAFTYAQIRNNGLAFISLMGVLKLRRSGHRHAAAVVWDGYRRGRAAGLMPAAEWETLLERPLEEVRRGFGLPRPAAYEAVRTEEMPGLS
jgi:ubiquinone biosynthesis protein COQ4